MELSNQGDDINVEPPNLVGFSGEKGNNQVLNNTKKMLDWRHDNLPALRYVNRQAGTKRLRLIW